LERLKLFRIEIEVMRYVCECGWIGKNINSVIAHVGYTLSHGSIEIYRPGVDCWFDLEKVPKNIRDLTKSVEFHWKYLSGVYYTPRSYICKEHLEELRGRQGVIRHLENKHDVIIIMEKMRR